MNTQHTPMPAEGIDLGRHHLFLVDITEDGASGPQRRAFLDVRAVVSFIGKREARLFAFASALGAHTDAVLFGVVEEIYESRRFNTHLVKFSNAPALVLQCNSPDSSFEFEAFHRIYPA
jgi:hypothetical protein